MFVSIRSKLISFIFVVIGSNYIKITIKTCPRNKRTPRSSFIYYSTALNPDSVGVSVTMAGLPLRSRILALASSLAEVKLSL